MNAILKFSQTIKDKSITCRTHIQSHICSQDIEILKIFSFVVTVVFILVSWYLWQGRAVLRSLTLDVHWGVTDLLTLIYKTFSHGGRPPSGTPLWGRGTASEKFWPLNDWQPLAVLIVFCVLRKVQLKAWILVCVSFYSYSILYN